MITCPTCGAQNDPGNRFCDQCGTRLEAPAPTAVAPMDQPTVTADTCPNCGAAVVPGEAFCDNCGAALEPTTAIPAPSPDAPTMLAAPVVTMPADAAATVACPSCGHMNLPGERFCENCGADLSATPTTAVSDEVAIPIADVSSDRAETVVAPGDDPPTSTLAETSADAQTVVDPLAAGGSTSSSGMTSTDVPPPVERAAPATLDAPVASDEERLRLEAEIVRQDQIIAQFEQMQATFGAATPPAVVQGLSDARVARDQAAAELAALGAAPAAAPTATPVTTPPAIAVTATSAADATPSVPGTAPIAPPPAAGPRLVIVEGGQVLKLPTDAAEITVGREDPVSNIFPEIDMTAFGGEAGGVSRQHARLTQSNGQWMIIDLNSTNYTRVDGTRLEPNVAVPLRDGVRIQFGRIATIFHL